MEKLLVLFLRLTAAILLLAIPFIFVPHAWMDAIHQALGLGALPDRPIVGYLTRSESLLYAMMGVIYWYGSCDVRRYLPLLRFSAWLLVVFTAIIIGIDVVSGLPTEWIVTEAVVLLLWGAGQFWLAYAVKANEPIPSRESVPSADA
jgi:hypothetical protein